MNYELGALNSEWVILAVSFKLYSNYYYNYAGNTTIKYFDKKNKLQGIAIIQHSELLIHNSKRKAGENTGYI